MAADRESKRLIFFANVISVVSNRKCEYRAPAGERHRCAERSG
jgi:hypothetical protein